LIQQIIRQDQVVKRPAQAVAVEAQFGILPFDHFVVLLD